MGVAGWRFAHGKRNPSGRAAIVAVLEDWQVICSVVVVAGSMIMLGIMLESCSTICSSDYGWRALGADLELIGLRLAFVRRCVGRTGLDASASAAQPLGYLPRCRSRIAAVRRSTDPRLSVEDPGPPTRERAGRYARKVLRDRG